jgi:hypothetical protein
LKGGVAVHRDDVVGIGDDLDAGAFPLKTALLFVVAPDSGVDSEVIMLPLI